MQLKTAAALLIALLLPLSGTPQVNPPFRFRPSALSGTVPTVTAVTGNVDNTEDTTHLIRMPLTVNAGDLLLVFIGFQTPTPGTTVVTWDDTTFGAWTLLAANVSGRLQIYGKVAVGDEDDGILTVTTDVSARHARRAYSIGSWEGTIAGGTNANTVTSATSTAPNSGVATDSWGTVARMTMSCFSGDGTLTVSVYPYTLSNGVHATGGTGTDISVGVSAGTGIVGVQDPGAFTISASVGWRAFTISIRGLP